MTRFLRCKADYDVTAVTQKPAYTQRFNLLGGSKVSNPAATLLRDTTGLGRDCL
jgi:hypothetical protein